MAPTVELVALVIIVQLGMIAYLLRKIRLAIDKTRLTWLEHVYERYEDC